MHNMLLYPFYPQRSIGPNMGPLNGVVGRRIANDFVVTEVSERPSARYDRILGL